MKRLCAGDLNKRVLLRRSQELPGIDMSTVPNLVESKSVWAKLDAAGGAVYYGTVQTDKVVTHYLYIRKRPVTVEWDVVYSGRVFRVRRCELLNNQPEFMRLDLEELGHV